MDRRRRKDNPSGEKTSSRERRAAKIARELTGKKKRPSFVHCQTLNSMNAKEDLGTKKKADIDAPMDI